MSRSLVKELPSGGIYLEAGADGLYLQFDCDCLDALPYCQAACCCLAGISVEPGEEPAIQAEASAKGVQLNALPEDDDGDLVMPRRADGWCRCNSPEDRKCLIYSYRSATCREFHCTRGANMRGWWLSLNRLPDGE